MSDNLKFSPEQISILLKIVAARTGKDPIVLRDELSSGAPDGILDALGADREQIAQLVNNREELEKMLSSPQVKALLQQLLGQGQ